jgi:hypothetical protein
MVGSTLLPTLRFPAAHLICSNAPRTTGIQAHALPFFGGEFANQAFHAATVCR